MNQGQYNTFEKYLRESRDSLGRIEKMLQLLVDRQTPTLGLGALPAEPAAEEPKAKERKIRQGPGLVQNIVISESETKTSGAKLPE